MMNSNSGRVAAFFVILIGLFHGGSIQAQSVNFVVPMEYPATSQEAYVEHDGVEIFYAEWGSGDPVILLHGGLGSIESFAYQIPALEQSHRVIAIDSRGHGRSTRDATPYSYSLMADDVIAVMDALGISSAAFVGWSDGGNIILDMSIRYPDRVERGFLLGANYRVDGIDLSELGTDPNILAAIAALDIIYASVSPTPDERAAFVEQLLPMWSNFPNHTDEELGSINSPIVVAHGLEEEAVLEDHSIEMARLIPNGHYLPLPDLSHFALWQDPERVTREIQAFLD